MLKRENRLTKPEEFRETRRRSVRTATTTVLVHVKNVEGVTRFGFIVPNSVGKAVVRNKVKRRLRDIAQETLVDMPAGKQVVVQAFPAAAGASYETLRADLIRALRRAR